VVVVEAMKMLHSLTAPGGGEIAEVRVTAGDAVESGQVLVTFNTPDSHGESR
jgi:biotin carboxyl carrier protein